MLDLIKDNIIQCEDCVVLVDVSNVRHNHVSIITRLQSSNKSIQVRGERLWNNISEDNRAISTLSCFKKIIKRMLIENHD